MVMLRKIFVSCLLLLFALTEQLASAAQPNVVFLLSDDQGWTDYEFLGHPHIQTPNLETIDPR